MILLGVMHFVAEFFYLYWTFWWFDNVMHFLGGVTGGLIMIWFFFDSGSFHTDRFSTTNRVIGALLSVLFVGVLWEIFEYKFGVTGFEGERPGYRLDVVFDLTFDFLGALLVSFIGLKSMFRIRD